MHRILKSLTLLAIATTFAYAGTGLAEESPSIKPDVSPRTDIQPIDLEPIPKQVFSPPTYKPETDASEAPSTSPQQWQAVRKDILEIRRRLGVNPLQGTDLESDDDLFGSQLDTAANQRSPMVSKVQPVVSSPEPKSQADPYIDALREACRQLEQRAAQLETARDTTGSDKLRRLARRIRNEARAADGLK